MWQDLEFIKKYVSKGDKVLDLGCGNGRLTELLKDLDIKYIGIDSSEKLISLAKKKYPNYEFLKADALKLPFENNSFDKVISIAVLHHIPSRKLRLQFLKEIKRVLKPNGKLVLTIWNLWQLMFFKYHWKYFVLKITGRSKLDFFDIFYPWKDQDRNVIAQRYIHCCTSLGLRIYALAAGLRNLDLFIVKKRTTFLIAKKA